MATPSEILRKTKKLDKDDTSQKAKTDKQGDEHDEKMAAKGSKHSALIDFIAKCKKA